MNVDQGTTRFGIAPANSVDTTTVVLRKTLNALDNSFYVGVATGVIDPSMYADNPNFLNTEAELIFRRVNDPTDIDSTGVTFQFFNAVSDAPAISAYTVITTSQGQVPVVYADSVLYTAIDTTTRTINFGTTMGTANFRFEIGESGLSTLRRTNRFDFSITNGFERRYILVYTGFSDSTMNQNQRGDELLVVAPRWYSNTI